MLERKVPIETVQKMLKAVLERLFQPPVDLKIMYDVGTSEKFKAPLHEIQVRDGQACSLIITEHSELRTRADGAMREEVVYSADMVYLTIDSSRNNPPDTDVKEGKIFRKPEQAIFDGIGRVVHDIVDSALTRLAEETEIDDIEKGESERKEG